jgi:hypothetical protein
MAFNEEGYGPQDGDDEEIGFSSPGSANISNPTSGGYQIAVPEFFDSGGADPVTDGISPSDPTTPREEAFRESGLGGKFDREQAPRIS